MATTNKIIFLDIDGVWNNHGGDASGLFALPQCVQSLNRIIYATDARVVICSMWRYLVHSGYMTIGGLATMLRSHGFHGVLIDVTRPSRDDETESEPRWKQIADWLKRPLCPVSRYAIIDDDPGAFGGRPGVQTNPAVGLTMEDAERVIEILNA